MCSSKADERIIAYRGQVTGDREQRRRRGWNAEGAERQEGAEEVREVTGHR
jgi:hypothetical protein